MLSHIAHLNSILCLLSFLLFIKLTILCIIENVIVKLKHNSILSVCGAYNSLLAFIDLFSDVTNWLHQLTSFPILFYLCSISLFKMKYYFRLLSLKSVNISNYLNKAYFYKNLNLTIYSILDPEIDILRSSSIFGNLTDFLLISFFSEAASSAG